MSRWRLGCAAATILLVASPSSAKNPRVGWGDTTGTIDTIDIYPNCADPEAMTLVASFTAPADVDSLYRLEAHIDFCTAPFDLPRWWRFEDGGCRDGMLSVSADFTAGPSTHTDPWLGSAGAHFEFLAEHISPARARIDVVVELEPEDVVSLTANTHYYAFQVRFDPPGGVCDGCTLPACFVINDSVILSHAGGTTEIPGNNYDNYALYRGGNYAGFACPFVVPVEPTSWGRTKASFRE